MCKRHRQIERTLCHIAQSRKLYVFVIVGILVIAFGLSKNTEWRVKRANRRVHFERVWGVCGFLMGQIKTWIVVLWSSSHFYRIVFFLEQNTKISVILGNSFGMNFIFTSIKKKYWPKSETTIKCGPSKYLIRNTLLLVYWKCSLGSTILAFVN